MTFNIMDQHKESTFGVILSIDVKNVDHKNKKR